MLALTARMVDVVYPLHGRALPRDHGAALGRAMADALPWLADEAGAALHPVRLVPGTGARALLSARARLLLRVGRTRADELLAQAPPALHLSDEDGAEPLWLGPPHLRELLPHTTLYAAFVTAETAAPGDEAAFIAEIDRALAALEVACHRVCGLAQTQRGAHGEPLHGFSLMLHGLRPAASLRVLEEGLGTHRLQGCGVFVPHKSAAAVGA